jgi:predicted HNH restriction endonuclease
MSKFCGKCNERKPLTEFYSRGGKRIEELTAWCKSCLNALTLERQRERKQEAIEYKGNKCQLCGYDKYKGALEFHHIDPTKKDFALSAGRLTSLEKLKPELDKCVLLCANCHREVHANLV